MVSSLKHTNNNIYKLFVHSTMERGSRHRRVSSERWHTSRGDDELSGNMQFNNGNSSHHRDAKEPRWPRVKDSKGQNRADGDHGRKAEARKHQTSKEHVRCKEISKSKHHQHHHHQRDNRASTAAVRSTASVRTPSATVKPSADRTSAAELSKPTDDLTQFIERVDSIIDGTDQEKEKAYHVLKFRENDKKVNNIVFNPLSCKYHFNVDGMLFECLHIVVQQSLECR